MKFLFGLTFILLIRFGSNSLTTVYPTIKGLPISGSPGEPLILTPLIENGNATMARHLSRVNLPDIDIESYSGFFTVDKKYNSNMFFWFIPAINNNAKAPLLLWLEGGPGVSSLYGMFEEIGPFYLNKQDKLKLRKYSWSNTHAVIYIDSPVGTGYSFTDKDEGYSRNEVDIAKNVYSVLLQFFQLFPEYKRNDFFITGESYAGKFVPAVSYLIHNKNQNEKFKINLKGLAMGNAFCDPEHMVTSYGDYLYQIGLIDARGRDMFHVEENKGVELIKQKNWIGAVRVFDALLDGSLVGYPSLFYNLTGFKYYFNYLKSVENSPFGFLYTYIQRENIRKIIHVGNATFNDGIKVNEFLLEDIMQSVKPWVEKLLEHYRVVIYSGQLDINVAYPYTLGFLNALNWSGTEEYKNATRNKWYVGEDLAGYSKTVKNFTEVLVRNAGHLVPQDQPLWVMDLITRFTSNKPIF